MKFAIYARVSTSEQTTQNQVVRLKEIAERNNWEYEIFEEKESSRKTRPIKLELLNRLRNKEYDGVMIYKLDRWARSLQELITEFSQLMEKEVVIYSYSDNIDLSTSAGKLQFKILGAFAEFERDIISERTKEGLNRARKEGKMLGRRKGSKDRGQRRTSGYHERWKNSPKKNKEYKTYLCPKCNKLHSKTSKKGIKHYRYFEKGYNKDKSEESV